VDITALCICCCWSGWQLSVSCNIAGVVYGHEPLHHHLRLLTAVKVLLCLSLYHVSSTDYYTADNRLVLSVYNDFVQGIVKDSNYSDMSTVLSLSSVVQKPIHTKRPLESHGK